MYEEEIGKVIGYIPSISVAIIKLSEEMKGELSIGDVLHFRSGTTDFEEKIKEIQIDNKTVKKAVAGDEIGIKVANKAQENDHCLKVFED